MNAATKPRSLFGDRLRRELDRTGVSIRGLSRRLDPKNPDAARRNLTRWIGGHNVPTPANRDAVADALGVDRSVFSEDEDEEAELVAALVATVRAVARHEAERVLLDAGLTREGDA